MKVCEDFLNRIVVFGICFFFSFCSSFLKKNVYLLDEKLDKLQRDAFFIVGLDKNIVLLFSDREVENYEAKFRKLIQTQEPNLYSIYAAKTGNLELAEKIWFELLNTKTAQSVSFLNLMRTFYILEDWEGMKNLFEKLHLEQNHSFQEAKTHIKVLESQNRFGELLLYLDYISNYFDLEISERIFVGNSYLNYGETKQARAEFEKVLSVYPFHKEGLEGMLKVYFYEEKYETAEIFLRNLIQFHKLSEDVTLTGMEIFYKLGKYEEGLKLLKQATPKEKKKFFFLWRALSYSSNYKNIQVPPQFLEFYHSYSPSQEVKIFQKILASE